MSRFQPVEVQLTAEQLAEAERIEQRLLPAATAEVKRIAQLVASKPDRQLFGQNEFELRDRVHALAAEALEITADERSKNGRLSAS